MGLFTVNNIAEGTTFVTMDSPKFVLQADEDVAWRDISLPLGQFPPDATVWSRRGAQRHKAGQVALVTWANVQALACWLWLWR